MDTIRLRAFDRAIARAIRLGATDIVTWAIAILGFAIMYTVASANCATGGDCTFANGDLANWLFPKIKAVEKFFYQHLAGRFPFAG